MSISSTTSATSAPLTSISKYRALMMLAGLEQGFTYTQLDTMVDQYKKGTEVITLDWGNTKLKGFSHSKGKNSKLVDGQVAAKLQKAQTALGKPMADTQKWSLSKAKLAELDQLALATFKVIIPQG